MINVEVQLKQTLQNIICSKLFDKMSDKQKSTVFDVFANFFKLDGFYCRCPDTLIY